MGNCHTIFFPCNRHFQFNGLLFRVPNNIRRCTFFRCTPFCFIPLGFRYNCCYIHSRNHQTGLCCNAFFHRICFHIHNHRTKELCHNFLTGRKFNRNNLCIYIRDGERTGIGKSMDADFSRCLIFFNLIQKPGDILVILTLCPCQSRILTDTFQCLFSSNLYLHGHHGR